MAIVALAVTSSPPPLIPYTSWPSTVTIVRNHASSLWSVTRTTNSKLCELDIILYGPSYFSPLLKYVTKRDEVDYVMIEEDLVEQEDFIAARESRFIFLVVDARSTLWGWRHSYRDVLLKVRKKLCVSCSTKLSTEDLEAEVFLHLVNNFSSEESGTFLDLWELSNPLDGAGGLELGLNQ
ncbi:unnamed protein product [Linum trigynum]|uniref:Uncharacterized protein n=1 Tax=Linum trigynum TaxID=586398 RepID=A0AAV2D754_9ROSI